MGNRETALQNLAKVKERTGRKSISKGKTISVTVELPDDLVEKLHEYIRSFESTRVISRSEAIRKMVAEKLSYNLWRPVKYRSLQKSD